MKYPPVIYRLLRGSGWNAKRLQHSCNHWSFPCQNLPLHHDLQSSQHERTRADAPELSAVDASNGEGVYFAGWGCWGGWECTLAQE